MTMMVMAIVTVVMVITVAVMVTVVALTAVYCRPGVKVSFILRGAMGTTPT